MKKIIIYPVVAVFLIAASIFTFLSCEDMFSDPLVDKDTGDDMTFLLVDMNFIKTKIAIYLEDFDTGESIEGDEIEIFIGGEYASNLINFAGEKPENFKTSSGFLELGYDPNYSVTEDTPLNLNFIAYGDNYFSIPESYTFTTEGTKVVTLRLINFGNQLKSGNGFDEPFDIELVGNPDQLRHNIQVDGFYGKFTRYNVYMVQANGQIVCNNIEDPVIYPEYGVLWYSLINWQRGNINEDHADYVEGPPIENQRPYALPTTSYEAQPLDIVITVAENSEKIKCETGLTINIVGQHGITGSGLFDYKIEFQDQADLTGKIQVDGFPHTELIGPFYYQNPNAHVGLTGDAQYKMFHGNDDTWPKYVDDPCGAEVTFTAAPLSDLTTYKLITKYYCSNTPTVGIALSIGGQFRKTGDTGDWTSFSFSEGVCEIQLKKNADYDFRVSVDGEWKEYTLPTDPSVIQAFLNANESEDFTVKSLTITETPTLITINAEVELDESICNII